MDLWQKKEGRINGGRNLLFLGVGAILIATITTAISLSIYRSTGDIYLDRSRPGYISEGEKHNTEDDSEDSFSGEGAVTREVIDEYLKEFDKVKTRIEAAANDFSPEPLSDNSLSISANDDLAEPSVGGAS